MLRFTIYFLAVINSFVYVESLSEGSSCTITSSGEEGTCQTLKNCPPIAKLFSDKRKGIISRFTPPTFCNQQRRILCCPQDGSVTTTTESTKKQRISEKKCREYAEKNYKTIFYPPLILGEPPVPRKVDQCKHKAVSLIVGGESAKEGEFPHQALLGYGFGEEEDYSCGGSLVSENFVITAAHCLQPPALGPVKYVRIGVIHRDEQSDHRQDFEVKEIFKHPNYNRNFNEDIGLLKLDGKVIINERTIPICLPQKYISPEKAIATGFGRTGYRNGPSDSLLKVTLEKFTREVCQTTFGSKVTITNDTMLCYGHHTEAKDACNGDSGGPLQVFNTDPYCTYTLVGTVSFGLKKCGAVGKPGVYVNVYHYLDWIEGIVWKGET